MPPTVTEEQEAKLASSDKLGKKIQNKFPHASASLRSSELKSVTVPYLPNSIYVTTACYPILMLEISRALSSSEQHEGTKSQAPP